MYELQLLPYKSNKLFSGTAWANSWLFTWLFLKIDILTYWLYKHHQHSTTTPQKQFVLCWKINLCIENKVCSLHIWLFLYFNWLSRHQLVPTIRNLTFEVRKSVCFIHLKRTDIVFTTFFLCVWLSHVKLKYPAVKRRIVLRRCAQYYEKRMKQSTKKHTFDSQINT